MRKFFITITISIFPIVNYGQENISIEDISKKLDLVLEKIEDLDQRVSKLESSNAEVRKEVKQVAESAEEARKTVSNIPQNSEEKKSFLQKLGNQLKTQQTLDSGPWTKKESWNQMRRNISAYQVRKILGTPSKIKKSINPRIDQVYLYLGDLNADGEENEGSVTFYRDRVTSFISPF